MDPRLARLRSSPFSNDPRFYQPGQHPATAMLRAQLAKLKAFKVLYTGRHIERLDESIAYLEDKLAAFEEAETETKYHVLKRLEHRERR